MSESSSVAGTAFGIDQRVPKHFDEDGLRKLIELGKSGPTFDAKPIGSI